MFPILLTEMCIPNSLSLNHSTRIELSILLITSWGGYPLYFLSSQNREALVSVITSHLSLVESGGTFY